MEPVNPTQPGEHGHGLGQIPPILTRPEQAAHLLAISRSRVYELLASGELQSIQIGSSRRIPLASLDHFVAERLSESRLGVPVGPDAQPESTGGRDS
jgi:excisionase family DNA binding protein